MAIDGTVSSGLQFELAIAEEATFGTAITATTTDLWKLLHLVGTPEEWDLSGITKDFTMRARGSRIPSNEDYYTNRGGGEVVIPFTVLATDITLDLLMYGVIQSVDEGETPAFAKVFQWGRAAATTQPQFTDNTGNFYTVILKNPISGEDMIATSCIIRDLTLSSDQATNGGRLTISGNFVSGLTSATKFLESGTQSIGTATQPGTTYYNHCNMVTKTITGADMIVDNFTITYNNKAARVGCDANGDAQTYALGAAAYEVTGSTSVLYDDNSKAFLANSLTSAFDTGIIFAWGSGNDPADTDGDLVLKTNGNFQSTNPARDFANEKGVMVAISFEGADDGTNNMVDNSQANATDRTWPT